MDKDRYPSSSDTEDDENDLGSILNRSSGRAFDFRSLIREIAILPESEEDDDDSEEGTKEKKKQKKFTLLLKNIFPKSIDELPARSSEAPKPLTSEQQISNIVPEKEEVFSDINTPEAYDVAAEAQTILEPEYEIQEPAEAPEMEVAKEDKELVEEDAEEDQPANKENPVPRYAPPIISEFSLLQPKPELPTPLPVETAVVEKQKPVGAILAFLGAEFLSRRRDKKLEKSLNKQSKELNARIEAIKPSAPLAEAESLGSILKRTNYSTENRSFQSVARVPEQQITETTIVKNITTNQKEPTLIQKSISAKPEVTISLEMSPIPTVRYETTPFNSNFRTEKLPEQLRPTNEIIDDTTFEAKNDNKRVNQQNKEAVGGGNGTPSYSTQFIYNDLIEPQSTKKTSAKRDNTSIHINDYKKSIQVGTATAILILIAFIIIYTSK